MDGEVMGDNSFFKPTLLYKEFMILDLIEKDANITQREISKTIGVAVSMVNSYLDEYEQKGYIKRKYLSTKTVEYFVTKKGLERMKVLNIGYLKSSHMIYSSAKNNIITFLNQIVEKGFKNILLYGAGEVAEILLQSIAIDKSVSINVLAVIDDDDKKYTKTIVNTRIIPLTNLIDIKHDGILISSYTNNNVILHNLIDINYDKNKIIQFFNQ